jgi:guanosine-3',5'-bis(diphosphate) 3'-pyrophosphohydrolase
MTQNFDMCLLFKAVAFAAEKHKNQRRKDVQASPYINHPIQVARILIEEGSVDDIDTLVAAILHDTLEDTETTSPELVEEFGESICRLVQEVTDDKALPKAERKRLQVVNAPHKSTQSKQIKIADKIANIRDILYCPPAGWDDKRKRDYVDWTESVFEGLRGVNQKLDHALAKCIKKARVFFVR